MEPFGFRFSAILASKIYFGVKISFGSVWFAFRTACWHPFGALGAAKGASRAQFSTPGAPKRCPFRCTKTGTVSVQSFGPLLGAPGVLFCALGVPLAAPWDPIGGPGA